MQSYTIHLIRHGLTQGNLLGQYIGSTDSSLCKEGIAELKKLKQNYDYPKAQAYFCSPLKRCKETMKILYPEAKPILIRDLREISFGEWEGKTAKELAAKDPHFAEWMESGKAYTPEGGESGGVFMQRTCLAFEKIVNGMLRSGTTSAVIVAHGGSLMSILSTYGLPRAKFYDWMTQSGCGYTMQIIPGLWMRSMVAEVCETIPPREKADPDDISRQIINAAREAADEAFGEKEKQKEDSQKETPETPKKDS